MMIAAAFFLAASGQLSSLPPANVADVTSAAVDCFDAVEAGRVDVARLTKSGWTRHILPGERSDLGQAYRRSGFNGEIAAVGPTCSLVAIVPSFDDVEAVLMAVDDKVKPDRVVEQNDGILIVKGNKEMLFFVGSPTMKKPAAIRIDVRRSDK